MLPAAGGAMGVAGAADLAGASKLLQAGVEVVKHNRKGKTAKRVLWVDAGLTRLVLNKAKAKAGAGPSSSSSSSPSSSSPRGGAGDLGSLKGVWLLDVGEVRPGCNSHNFDKGTMDATLGPRCCSVVGSERCLDLELPSSESRDFLVRGLRALVKQAKDARAQK